MLTRILAAQRCPRCNQRVTKKGWCKRCQRQIFV